MSFCVRNIGAEFADTPENDIEESIKQCRDFSTKREHIDVILAHLEVLAATIGSTCSKLGEAESKMVFREFNEMVKYSQEVKKLRSALEVNGLMPARLDTTTQIYPTFVQAILELNWAISNLNGLVAMINETSKA
jgi:hypothetical protein